MKRYTTLVVFFTFALANFSYGAPSFRFTATEGAIRFLAVGKPSAIRIRGEGEAPRGTATVNGASVTGEFEISLETLDTGIDVRTRHMKERYLETQKHPKSVFKITELKLPTPLESDGYSAEDVPVSAILRLHGVEKPVLGKASLKTKAGILTAKVKFPALVTAHEIPIPVYLGITVADQVEIEVDAIGKLEN